jgi:hypothetical protein
MKCTICKDKGYVVISGRNYAKIPCRCGQPMWEAPRPDNPRVMNRIRAKALATKE